jgi:hypothetical protein
MPRFQSIVILVLCVTSVVVRVQSGFAGKWQGETANGRQVVLDLRVKGPQLTGTFTLAQQTVDISDGKVTDKAFSFKVTLEGRSPIVSGERVGEQVRMTVEGVPNKQSS